MTDRDSAQAARGTDRSVWIAAAVTLLALVALAGVGSHLLRRKPPPDRSATEVPLGVEEAVIIRYKGPRLVPRPYRRGTSVNVRIADQQRTGDVGVYDVRYVINLPGQFDLTEYLMAADGSPLDDLPKFSVRGLTSLTKDLETRIREIQPVQVTIWHGYRETLVGLGIFWIAWLAGLIFVGRPKRIVQVADAPEPPSIRQRIAGLLAALQTRSLSVEEKAELEALLLLDWRDQLDLHHERMAGCCRKIAESESCGKPYAVLRSWLHDGRSHTDAQRFLEAYAAATTVQTDAGRDA
jgi:hypothetical protein